MEFVAFDVETANRRRDSICAVGYAVVRKGLVSESGTWLANPGPVEFDPWNTRIHGIRREDVNQAPPLPDVIARLVALIGEGVAVGDGLAMNHPPDGEFDLFAADRVGDVVDGVDRGGDVSWCGLFADGGAQCLDQLITQRDAFGELDEEQHLDVTVWGVSTDDEAVE